MGRSGHSQQGDIFAAAPLPVAPLTDAQRIACLRLIRSENVGPATFRALINHYGGAELALKALPEVGRRAGRGRPIRVFGRDQAEAELQAVAAVGARILFNIEPGFPAPLAFLEGAPPMLYTKGRLELLQKSTLAIVGSRQSSAAGQTMTRQLAGALGAAGHVIASGLARGIDSAAHQASLATGTIAVLAGGIDMIYPPENKRLYEAITEAGCVLAELPVGYQARAQDFPRRNRIISGISRAVIIVEAARRSGTLITARLAGEQGREVFAIPGHPLDPRAEGTNQLIKDGATMVTSADDVLQALGEQDIPRSPHLDSSPLGPHPSDLAEPPPGATDIPVSNDHALAAVEQVLGPAPINIDEVARATELPVRVVQVALMELSLAGRIEFHGNQLVSLQSRDKA